MYEVFAIQPLAQVRYTNIGRSRYGELMGLTIGCPFHARDRSRSRLPVHWTIGPIVLHRPILQ